MERKNKVLSTRHPSLQWPRIPGNRELVVLAIYGQLERAERVPADRIVAAQLAQLRPLLDHAVSHVPYYRDRLAALYTPGSTPLTMEAFRSFPILTRRNLQEAGSALDSENPIREHGTAGEVRSSGSTGQPISVKTNSLNWSFLHAINLRYHTWNRRDFAASVGGITKLSPKESEMSKTNRAGQWVVGYRSGPARYLDISRPAEEQLAWLAEHDFDYLMTYPSNLANLVTKSVELGITLPNLKEVWARSEVVSAEIREACQRHWKVPISETYSAQELGIVALQCPDGGGFHVMAEHYILEVLDDNGAPCAPGESGRVVVTALHNFLTPLIRYEIGDFAEVGAACSCGRTLPKLNRILGRTRNMLVLPDGRKTWPTFGTRSFHEVAPVRQHQVVQTALDHLEVKIVPGRPFTEDETNSLSDHILSRLPAGFSLSITFHEEIPRGPSGKFEDFMSEVDTP